MFVSSPFSCMAGFQKCLAKMIIMPRRCVMCKNHVRSSKSRSQSALKLSAKASVKHVSVSL